MAVCLLCLGNMPIFKKYNIKRNVWPSMLSMLQLVIVRKERKALKLSSRIAARHNISYKAVNHSQISS